MIHILKIAAVIILVTYSLQLINAQSDLLVFSGLAVIGTAVYFLIREFGNAIENLNSKL